MAGFPDQPAGSSVSWSSASPSELQGTDRWSEVTKQVITEMERVHATGQHRDGASPRNRSTQRRSDVTKQIIAWSSLTRQISSIKITPINTHSE